MAPGVSEISQNHVIELNSNHSEGGGNQNSSTNIRSSNTPNLNTALLDLVKLGDAASIDQMLSEQNKSKSVNDPDWQGRTPLIWACILGHIEVVEILLRYKANLNLRDQKGRTALLWASQEGHLRVAELLCQQPEIDVNIYDNERRTPLIFSAMRGHADVAKFLSTSVKSLDREAVDSTGRNAFSWACGEGHRDVVEVFIENGCLRNVVDENGMSAFSYAVIGNHFHVVTLLVEINLRIDVSHNDGTTPLFHAVFQNQHEMVFLLIILGADFEISDHKQRRIISYAVEYGLFEILQLLISAGIELNCLDCNGYSPLYYAVREGQLLIAQLLIDYGVNLNFQSYHDGTTALMESIVKKDFEMMNLLLNGGAVVDLLDFSGRSALMYAIENNLVEFAQVLLHAGASPNLITSSGTSHGALVGNIARKSIKKMNCTPLMAAIQANSSEMVKLLLRHGADLLEETDDNRNAFIMTVESRSVSLLSLLINEAELRVDLQRRVFPAAAKTGNTALVQLLLDAGCDVDIRDKQGRTPLILASMVGNLKIVKMLLDEGANPTIRDFSNSNAILYSLQGEHYKVLSEICKSLFRKERRLDGIVDVGLLSVFAEQGDLCSIREMISSWQDKLKRDESEFLITLDAAKTGKIDIVKRFIKSGGSVNHTDRKGTTLLMTATAYKQIKIVDYLLRVDSLKIDVVDATNQSVTTQTMARGDVQMLLKLIQRRISDHQKYLDVFPVNGKRINGAQGPSPTKSAYDPYMEMYVRLQPLGKALLSAVKAGSMEMTQSLMKIGCHIEQCRDERGRTALSLAAEEGHIELMEILVEAGCSKDARDSRGFTALIVASMEGRVEIVSQLILLGSHREARDSRGRTALMWATRERQQEIVQILLDAGCDRETRDYRLRTPLICAAERDAFDIVELLIRSGCHLESRATGARTALSLAAEEGHVEVVSLLLSAMSKVELVDTERRKLFRETHGPEYDDTLHTVQDLWCARVFGIRSIIPFVYRMIYVDNGLSKVMEQIELRCDKDGRDADGRTALMHAAIEGHPEVVRVLLRYGCDPYLRDSSSTTALLHAASQGHQSVVDVIRSWSEKSESNASTRSKLEGYEFYWQSQSSKKVVRDATRSDLSNSSTRSTFRERLSGLFSKKNERPADIQRVYAIA